MKTVKLSMLLVGLLLTTQVNATVYEDAEDKSTSRWQVYDNTPIGAKVNNVYIEDRDHNAIKFIGAGASNGYILGNLEGKVGAWNNTNEHTLKWHMNFDKGYTVYVRVMTKEGARNIYYTASNKSYGNRNNGYIHIGLGSKSKNGTWQKFSRDLASDLKKYEPNNKLIAVNAFLIRGNGFVDDIELSGMKTHNSIEFINAPSPINIKQNSCTLRWSLNKPTTGQIEYGITTDYGDFSQKEESFTYSSHEQVLKNLQSDTIYHYRVISEDSEGGKIVSEDKTFTTKGIDGLVTPVNTNVPIWIIGDSTVVNGASSTPPRGGWGEFLADLVKNGGRVKNKAVSGSSAKSFFNNYWDKVKQEMEITNTSKGAYLFIEFGHNDRDNTKDGNIKKSTVPGLGNEYDDYLMKYIDFARENNVIPVLVTGTASMCNSSCGSRTYIRMNSLPSNTIPSPWKDMIGKVGDWPKTKRDVGAREDVTVLDLTTKSIEHFATFDNMQSLRDKYAWKPATNDDTHFNKVGAKKMAELLKNLACDLDNGGDAALCSQFKEDGTKRNTIFPDETAMTPIATKSIKKLAVGESVVGSAFGGTITRMTETGARTNGNEHPYAKTQAWNSDMSMIRLTFRLYDANTLKELSFTKGLSREAAYKKTSNGLSEMKWSSTNPNVFYGVKKEKSQFWKGTIDRENNTIIFKMLHDFGAYKDFRLGSFEGNIDFNDKYVVFSARKKDSDYLTAIIYDIEENKIKIKKDLLDIKFSEKPKPKRFDWISVDPKGEFVVIRDGYKVYRYDMNLNNKTTLAETAGHGDLGIDQNGDSIYVQWGFGDNNGVWMYRLKDLHKTKLMPRNYGSGHISCRNKDRKGWCYLSTVSEQYREVFAVKLSYDGPDSPIVNRFAQTHESGIRSSVATVSPDGSRVIFMSDWGMKVDDYRERSTYHVQFK